MVYPGDSFWSVSQRYLGPQASPQQIADETERAEKVKELTRLAEQNAKALNAATLFELDDVIDPAETRSVIASTLAAASLSPRPARGHRFVDTW